MVVVIITSLIYLKLQAKHSCEIGGSYSSAVFGYNAVLLVQ